MQEASNDLICRRGSGFYRALAVLSLPLVLQRMLLVAVNALSSLMMGQFGEIEMAAVSQASQIYYIYTVLTAGILSPLGILVAQYWGKRDHEAIRTLLGIAFRIGMIFAVVCTAAVVLFPRQIMRIMIKDEQVLAIGVKYLLITAVTLIPFCLSELIYYFVRAMGWVRVVFCGNVLCYAVNIVLNYVFIFGKLGVPAMGALGPAIGTLISRLVEVVFLVICLFSKKAPLQVRPEALRRFDGGLCRDYARVMRPILGHEIIWSFGVSAPQMVLGQLSTSSVAAYNIVYNLNQLLCAFMDGTSGGAQVLVGNTIGSGDIPRAKREARSIVLVATGIGLAAGVLMVALGRPFISLYNVEEATRDFAIHFIPTMAMAAFFSAWEIICLVGTLRAGGDAKVGFWTDLVSMWMLAIPLACLAAFRWNLSPVVVIFLIKLDMPIKSIVGLVTVLRMRWITNLTRTTEEA